LGLNEKQILGDSMANNEPISARIDPALATWLKEEARKRNCSLNDLIKEALLFFKENQANDLRENMRFSDLLHVQASKAAIMTYRLLESLVQKTQSDSKEIITKAGMAGLKEIAEWKLD
jgi:hypothetical protein